MFALCGLTRAAEDERRGGTCRRARATTHGKKGKGSGAVCCIRWFAHPPGNVPTEDPVSTCVFLSWSLSPCGRPCHVCRCR